MMYIRTDANQYIASGHLMRCLAIAQELRNHGEETTFIIADKSADQLLNKFPFILIKGNWNNLEAELFELVEIIKKFKVEKLIVDSYFATAEYFNHLSKYTKLIYLGSQERYFPGLSMVINYSNTLNKQFYEMTYNKEQTKLLLGVQYAPLRKEFSGITPILRKKVCNIIITTGSTDPSNLMEILARKFNESFRDDSISIHLIVGSMNRHTESLTKLNSEFSNIILHFNPSDVAEIMLGCDIAISAAGTTLYELCACGIPTICFSLTDEQEAGAIKFHQDEILFYIGNYSKDKELFMRQFEFYTELLLKEEKIRKEIGKRMSNYIDGNGTKRIAESIKML